MSSAGALAVASAEQDAAIDPVLTGALENPRERVNVLKYEDAIVQFMKASTKDKEQPQQLDFPPCSSYHRLLLYRLAQRFGLEHAAVEGEGSLGLDPNVNRTLVLFKTPQTAMPRVLLIDMCSRESSNGPNGDGKAPVMKLMRRSRPQGQQQPGGGGRGAEGGGGSSSSNSKEEDKSSAAGNGKSMTDRERAYAEARARIFGTDSTAASSSSSAPPSTGGLKGVKGTQAQGPAELGGFGAGRGKAVDAPGSHRQATPPKKPQQRADEEGGGGRRRSGGGGGEDDDGSGGGRWGGSESKVVWRDREAEKSDPDFARHRPQRGMPPGGMMMYPPPPPPPGGGYPMAPGPPGAYMMGAPPPHAYMDPYLQQQQQQQHQMAMYQHYHNAGAHMHVPHPGAAPQYDPRYMGGMGGGPPPPRGYNAPRGPSPYYRGGGGEDYRHRDRGQEEDFPPLR